MKMAAKVLGVRNLSATKENEEEQKQVLLIGCHVSEIDNQRNLRLAPATMVVVNIYGGRVLGNESGSLSAQELCATTITLL